MFTRGAEAVLSADGSEVVKERLQKGYRIPQLDAALRKRRTRAEARLLREAGRAGVPVPRVLEEAEFVLRIERIDGEPLRAVLTKENAGALAAGIGSVVAKLHAVDIVHGDLTTSNMLLRGSEVVLIDFGLGFFSQRAEDKANDLYVLHEALDATHPDVAAAAWTMILKAYREHYGGAPRVATALSAIEKRRRYAKS